MRPLKFRAWDEEAETMYYSDKCWENAEATFVCESEGTLKCYVPEIIEATHDEPEHIVGRELSGIMQFTGLKDKNGKGDEVYKDDIVSSFNGVNYLVYYDTEYGQWWGRIINKTKGKYARPLCEILDNSYMKVIGNIHENPELLEQDNG